MSLSRGLSTASRTQLTCEGVRTTGRRLISRAFTSLAGAVFHCPSGPRDATAWRPPSTVARN
ncbi:hypothetical protein [Arthrobacter sp. ISL-28]|uniref:hypothetical protein n=1 Tax=Arthrobacter sp. ISL-28 TaxID=2819108 RepID=UPI002035E846|nr:hypothetical protein [Arthrobacter sp. ISL-28]